MPPTLIKHGYCCSSHYLCPNKAEYYVEESSQMPRSCTLGGFITCPSGYTCQSAHYDFTTGHCCKGGHAAVSDGCPPNEYAFMKGGEIASCDPFNHKNSPCPSGYSCQWSIANQRYQCCGSAPVNIPKKKTCQSCNRSNLKIANSLFYSTNHFPQILVSHKYFKYNLSYDLSSNFERILLSRAVRGRTESNKAPEYL
ncbi:unnamed protein product [Anisakis simplex]|uniref:CC domain-containing protein n=1 Tax=Anisakis simplex TaxID=6269 RepID=A0A0M3JC84_ANISI|nr:unnamed protein product [Anisakis simplex]